MTTSASAAADLASPLLAAAGIDAADAVVEPLVSEGLINTHALVRVPGHPPLVVRAYGWPWPGDEPFDRGAKEAWLLPRLEAAGVAAPRLVAAVPGGLLTTFVDGATLGATDRPTDAMWRAAGAALRDVHDADVGLGDAPVGMIVAGGVDAFVGGWATWHVENTRRHADAVARLRPDLPVDVERCVATVERAREHLDARPRRLVHTDANPWNVLVTPGATPAATWMDWEFAWIADPLYDFSRMTFARKHDLGPLPGALFDGYGGDPRDDVTFDVYALGFHIWMVHEATYPILPLQTTYATADAYVRELPEHLTALERRL